MDNVARAREKGKGIKVSFSGRGLTPFGGIGLLGGLRRRLRVKEALEQRG